MENTLIVCGGTGAHTAVAFLRLHTLGHALGFFGRGEKPFDFPTLYLVDQDAGDGAERPTAWQLARSLVAKHPARGDWARAIGRPEAPELIAVTPLPVGKNDSWFQRPYNTLDARFEGSELPRILTSRFQRDIDFSKGMMGSPALGSLLFRLKQHDERSRGLNRDERYGDMMSRKGRVVVAASGVGGTGASVGPTVARRLAELDPGRVMAVMILNWFEFNDDVADEEVRTRAQRRNRLMRENANSALEFYGQQLARRVAAVPVGMPDSSLIRRSFTGDVGQPIEESFVHAVGALCGYRHFLSDDPYGPGLYMMGATERGRLDGATPIPGGTLQGLANQGATLADLLETWAQILSREHDGRVRPAVYDAVDGFDVDPSQVADHLREELAHYREQLRWLEGEVGVTPHANRSFTREIQSRRRLRTERRGLGIPADSSPREVASALFHWTAEWLRDAATPEIALEVQPAEPQGGQWPDLRNASGLGVRAERNGDLNRIDDANRDAVIEAFVDPAYVTANGWPHPLAAADFFDHAIQRKDLKATRQLELLLVGVVSGELELRSVRVDGTDEGEISLDRLLREYRRSDWEGLAELAVVDPERGGQPIAFTSPHTVFAPVPYMNDDADNRLWNSLWRRLSGATDGADWDEAPEPESWGDHDVAIRQVLTWIEHQRDHQSGSPPPWTQVFARFRGEGSPAPYGAGRKIRVYWGPSGDPERPLIELNLPTSEPDDWELPEGTATVAAEELLSSMPDLLEVTDEDGRTVFSMVEIRIPGREGVVRGFWDRHLDELQTRGQIHLWSKDKHGAVVLGVMKHGRLEPVRIADSRLLDRSTVAIRTCTPLAQDPVPGSNRTAGQLLYPDIPLRPEYIDLVRLDDGRRLVDLLREGIEIDPSTWQPKERRDTEGRRVIQWSVPVRGIPDELLVEIRSSAEEKPHEAHWMVWPRFRTKGDDGWKTYYLYDYCTNKHLRLETLWVEEGRTGLARREVESDGHLAYPLSYRVDAESPAHTGGPPVAVSLRHTRKGDDEGIFLVPLELYSKEGPDLDLAVDFGTSHSAAAASVGGDTPRPVDFAAELDRNRRRKGLTLHLSESSGHVHAAATEPGILATGSWLPTYTVESQGILPSDLILTRPLTPAQADQIARWEPAKHYTIPPLDIGRENLAEFVLTDFKWDVGSSYFRGQEGKLQEHYLSLFLELVVAETVADRARGFPRKPVNVLFTYPLRTHRDQVAAFQKSVERTLRRCSDGMGISLVLKDGEGIYDESRAAQLTSKQFGEVCLVGDLGGGTLDLFISAHGRGDRRFPEVADSAQIGGNLLLRKIAESPDGLLPVNGHWRNGSDARDTETKLRAWMRSFGAPRLFGTDAGGSAAHPKLGVFGFDDAADARKARALLDRYFRLVAEYMARNLTAYLVRHWFPQVDPKDFDRLRISVQLRGNGWRLRYQDETYDEATARVQELVKERVLELWDQINDNPFPEPGSDALWADIAKYRVADPKTAPITSVVTQEAMPHDEVRRRWHTHPLVDLEVERSNDERHEVEWWQKVPFKTWGSSDVALRDLSPPLLLSSPDHDERFVLSTLDAERSRKVESVLEKGVVNDRGLYEAPVAAAVWEAVFDTPEFWAGE